MNLCLKYSNGAEVYTGDDDGTRGSLATTTELLVAAQEKGWTTRDHHRDFTLWKPREWNQLADYYANYCMTKKCTWQETFEKAAYVHKTYSFQAFSDGGKETLHMPLPHG